MKSPSALLISCLVLQGCGGDLIIRDSDSAGMVTSKVTARVGLGLITLGLSEAILAFEKSSEEDHAGELQAQQGKQNWFNGQVGKLTYAEALAKWGPPIRSHERKGIIVAVWERRSESPGYVVIPPISSSAYAPTMAAAIPGSGSRLQLVFDRDTEVLRSWSVQDW